MRMKHVVHLFPNRVTRGLECEFEIKSDIFTAAMIFNQSKSMFE